MMPFSPRNSKLILHFPTDIRTDYPLALAFHLGLNMWASQELLACVDIFSMYLFRSHTFGFDKIPAKQLDCIRHKAMPRMEVYFAFSRLDIDFLA